MPVDVVMPQMGESIFEGTITKWLKKPGDKVERDEPLFEISTDKVDAEIPSPTAGVLKEIKVPEGQTVPIQTIVAVIDGAGSAAAPAPAPAPAPALAPAAPPPAAKPAQAAPAPAPVATKPAAPAPKMTKVRRSRALFCWAMAGTRRSPAPSGTLTMTSSPATRTSKRGTASSPGGSSRSPLVRLNADMCQLQ